MTNPFELMGHALTDQLRILELERENKQLRLALAFAKSVIKSGEPWTEECERLLK